MDKKATFCYQINKYFDIIIVGCDYMKEFFTGVWEQLLSWYAAYFEFVHSIFPDKLGDYVVYLIDLAVTILIVWLVAKAAFSTRGN